MNKCIAIVVITTLFYYNCLAQTTFAVTSQKTTGSLLKTLLQPNYVIANNDTLNERIVDLVEPMLVDSVVERKKQHHRLFMVGWLIHAFGNFNWRAIDMTKQKFVGTVFRHSRSGEEQYTEYDINFDLYFHTDKYLKKVFKAYDVQRNIGRQDIRRSHKRDYNVPPFVRDTTQINMREYRLHCELTPHRQYRPALHQKFYPTLPHFKMENHQNFESDKPTMGMYGVWCTDCNHSCHPELHPYEWVWWLKAIEKDSGVTKTWIAGLFNEGSNRMPNWSKNPMTGMLKIPFAYRLKKETNDTLRIRIEHLVIHTFNADEMNKLPVPENYFTAESLERHVTFQSGTSTHHASINFNHPIHSQGLRYWFTELNLDTENQILSGYFHYAVSCDDLYTCRIHFEP